MAGPDPSGIAGMMSQTLSLLEQYRAATGATEAEPPAGEGQAADGLIKVRVEAPGTVTSLSLDPRVLRLPSEALAEELISAINAALAELRGKALNPTGTGDLSELSAKLTELQGSAGRQLTTFTDALIDAQERLVRRAAGA